MSAIGDMTAELNQLREERDSLRARLAEVEAQAAAMRDVLQSALPADVSGWWCPTCKCAVPESEVTFWERHEVCGTHLTAVDADEWRERARAALSSSAGRETAERLKRLEAVADKGRQLLTALTICIGRPYGCTACFTDPCSPECPLPGPINEFRASVHALEGDVFWVHTATDLTAPKTRERYRQRCLLMAAAQDLLKAAKAVLARIEDCCECPRSCRDCMTLDEAREMLQALIAKGQGRAEG